TVAAIDRVGIVAAIEKIVAGAADQAVGTIAPAKRIVAVARIVFAARLVAEQRIVAVQPGNGIAVSQAEDRAGVRRTDQRVGEWRRFRRIEDDVELVRDDRVVARPGKDRVAVSVEGIDVIVAVAADQYVVAFAPRAA